MKIMDFVNTILPHFQKQELLENFRITLAELDGTVLPSYSQAETYFKTSKFKSDENNSLTLAFYKHFDTQGGGKRSNLIAEINGRLPYIKANARYIADIAEELMERDIIAEGLTAKKACIVRASESLAFISRFSTDLLNLIYVNEGTAVGANIEENERLPPIMVRRVNNNVAKFAALVSDFGIPNAKFAKIVQTIPDVVINNRTANSIRGIYKDTDIDPFDSSYVKGFNGSPIFSIRMLVAEWQANRYKSNKDKKKVLELRLLNLKLSAEKGGDPKVQQEIDCIQGRIDKIDRYLLEVEEDLKDE